MKKRKLYFISFFMITIFLFSLYIQNISAAYDESAIGTYEEELSKFPDSFKPKIEALHIIYPNAIFVAQNKFFDWNAKQEVGVDWYRMIDSEYTTNGRSLIYDTYDDGYKATDNWAYSYYTNKYTAFSGGRWNAASKATIAYYLDSRNFLDERYVFMFESLLYHDYQTISGVEKILQGTFMGDKYCPGSTKKYSEVIMDAAITNNISAYMLASRLRQEQGTSGTSGLISGTYPGYEGYYNYFNVEANGTTSADVIVNGLKYAKEVGWNSAYNAIVGGAAFIKTEYVGINDEYSVKGQLTLYLQKWDPYGWKLGGHQYMQNITAPSSEASTTYNSYASVDGYKNYRYIFYIPIYENMPTVTYLPNPGNPNNWLSNLTINGATISGFDSAKKQYTVNVSEYTNEVTIDYIKISSYATVSGSGIVALTTPSTDVNVTVTAQNGDKNTYTITINKDSTAGIAVSEILNASGFKSDGTYLSGINVSTTVDDLKSKLLTIAPNASINIKNSSGSEKSGILCTGDTVTITSGSETKTYSVVIYGDVNGDGVLDSTDLLRIRQQLIGSRILSGANYQAANITKDTAVDSTDLLRMRQQLIGVKLITQ